MRNILQMLNSNGLRAGAFVVWCGGIHERAQGNPAIPKTGSVPERVREGGGFGNDCGYRP